MAKRNWKTRVGGNAVIIIGMFVAWFEQNQDTLTSIISPMHMVYMVMLVSAFNIILSQVEKDKKPTRRNSVNAKSTKSKVEEVADTKKEPTE